MRARWSWPRPQRCKRTDVSTPALPMGFDCTLHVIDPARIREAFCAQWLADRTPDAVPPQFDHDITELAHEIARQAICFSAEELPAWYERGFCLSLWAWRMVMEEHHAEVPRKHRASQAELDDLF